MLKKNSQSARKIKFYILNFLSYYLLMLFITTVVYLWLNAFLQMLQKIIIKKINCIDYNVFATNLK